MGGRGGSSGLGTNKMLDLISNAVEDEYAEYVKYERNPAGLVKSPVFMDGLKNAIGKQAFNRGYEITIKQVDSMAQQIIDKFDSQKKSEMQKIMHEEAKSEEARRYFREHYNPNREQREITSSAYKRAQKRLTQNVENFLGMKEPQKRKRKR